MPSLLSLHYPNGRSLDTEFPEDLKPGQEFELDGFQWKVVGVSVPPTSVRYLQRGERRYLCRQTGK